MNTYKGAFDDNDEMITNKDAFDDNDEIVHVQGKFGEAKSAREMHRGS